MRGAHTVHVLGNAVPCAPWPDFPHGHGIPSVLCAAAAMDLPYGSQLQWALALAVAWDIALRLVDQGLGAYLTGKPWLPHTLQNGRRMAYGFGFPQRPGPGFPEGVSHGLALEMYLWLCHVVVCDGVSGALTLPAALAGWAACGVWGRRAFVVGTLLHLGSALRDFVRITLATFMPHAFGLSRLPLTLWVIMCVLHHPTSLALVIPTNLRYLHHPIYHQVCAGLLFGSSLVTTAGVIRLTLDTTRPRERLAYNAMVLFQALLVVAIRLVHWVPAYGSGMWIAAQDREWGFVCGGLLFGGLLSLFNAIIVWDNVGNAAKVLAGRAITARDE